MESGGASSRSVPASARDLAWKYVRVETPGKKNNLICNFCGKVTKGGISRAKQHIVGGYRNTKVCQKCPLHVRQEISDFMEKKMAANNLEKLAEPEFEDDDASGDEQDLDDIGARATPTPTSSKSVTMKKKRPRQIGPIDTYFTSTPTVQGKKGGNSRQTTINEAYKKEMREKVCRDITRWMYEAAIPFNAVNYPSFRVAVESIGQYGIGLKPPSYHEVRVPFLRKEVDSVKMMLKSYEEEWATYGCSIMADGWTDKKQRTLINFLVNSPRGSVFLESVDASEHSKTGKKMFELIDRIVERVGEANVVQVVTDSASNNVYAGKLLQATRPHLYWTPCAAHCIDLIMEDIGKLSVFNTTLKNAMSVNAYIYVRPSVVHLLREFTSQRELVRAGVTRFATAYLTLVRMHKQKHNLRKMFLSEEWTSSKWAKEVAGKHIAKIILTPRFWSNITYILKIYGPLVRVLRIVDGEKRPAMGYIYEAMDRAKEAIMNSFKEKEEKYEEVFKIIDKRWECQLHQPLHAAGFYLNPEFFDSSNQLSRDGEVVMGFYEALERLVPDHAVQDKISDQLTLYHNEEGLFGMNITIRHKKLKSPAEWWKLYGSKTPELQKFAVKVLSLTCSASGCERNWSIFEHIHSKKRNRLDQKRLNDLVYVKYNLTLKRNYDARDRIDPICLREIDESNEWLMGRMEEESDDDEEENELVFDDDDLTWGDVSKAAGVEEPAYNTRKGKNTLPVSTSSLGAKKGEKGKASSFRVGVTERAKSSLRLIDEGEESEFEEDEEYEVDEEGEELELELDDEDDVENLELDDD